MQTFSNVVSTVEIKKYSLEELREYVPHIFQEKPSKNVSEIYKFYPTKEFLKLSEKYGFYPCKAWGTTKSKYGIHQVFLRKPEDIKNNDELKAEGKKEILQISFLNSFDGKVAFNAEFGIFVPVCNNGLLLKSKNLNFFRQIHKKIDLEEMKEKIENFFLQEKKLWNVIEKMKQKILNPKEQNEFLEKALATRFSSKILKENKTFLKEQLLMPIRENDKMDNLWTLYNNVEERFVNGLLFLKNGRKIRKIKEKGLRKIYLERSLSELADSLI